MTPEEAKARYERMPPDMQVEVTRLVESGKTGREAVRLVKVNQQADINQAEQEAEGYLAGPSTEDKLGAGAMAAADTMGFGLADEVRGLGAGALNLLRTGDVGESVGKYQGARDEQRAADAEAQEAAPESYGIGQLLGNIPALIGGGAAASKAGIKAGAAIGAGTGAAGGFGHGEGIEDSLKGAGKGTVVGGVLGGLAGRLGAGARPSAPTATPPVAPPTSGIAQRGADYVSKQGGIFNALKRAVAKKVGDEEIADVVAPKPVTPPTPEPPSPFGRIPAPEPAVGTSTAQALQAKLGQPPPTGLTFPEPAPAPSQTFGRPITQPLDDNLAGALERPLPTTAPLAAGPRKLSQRFNLDDELAIMHSMPSAERQAYFTQLTQLHGQNQGGGIAKLASEFPVTPSRSAPAMSVQPPHIRAASMEGAHTPQQWLTGTPHKEQNPLMAQAMESQRIGKAPAASHPSEMFKQLQARGGDPVEAQKLVDMARASGWPDAQIRQWLDEAGLGVGGP